MKPHFRDQRGKHIHEDAAMQIVLAVKHDIAPDMDDNAGGELLGWILQLTEDVATSPALAEAAVPPRGEIGTLRRYRLNGYRLVHHPAGEWVKLSDVTDLLAGPSSGSPEGGANT